MIVGKQRMIEMLEHKAFWMPIIFFGWSIISWEVWNNGKHENRLHEICWIVSYIALGLSFMSVFYSEIGEWWWALPKLAISVVLAVIGTNYISDKGKIGLSYLGLVGLPILAILIINMNVIAKSLKYY